MTRSGQTEQSEIYGAAPFSILVERFGDFVFYDINQMDRMGGGGGAVGSNEGEGWAAEEKRDSRREQRLPGVSSYSSCP